MKYATGAEIWEGGDVLKFFPPKRPDSHKGDYGVACILGGAGSVGASILAVGACLKSGAGYTKLFLPPEIYPYSIGAVSPACVLRAYGGIDEELLKADCVALGMGAGVGEELYATIRKLLLTYRGTLVLDADALMSLGQFGVDALKEKSCRVIVTPHPKEFARLTGKSVEELLGDPIRHAQEFSTEYGVTVVFKNNRTVIAEGERVAINSTGSPVLAKGGSGDVLSGFLAGTCARGVSSFEAAAISCYLLGRAGELAAVELGEYAPDATDIISYLPSAILSVA